MMHCLKRTSPRGEEFIGYCIICGKTRVTIPQAFEECENPNNISQEEVLLRAVRGPMTLEQLNEAMIRDIQLHESVEVIYVVDGWQAIYSPDDGNTEIKFHRSTPIEALIECFSEIRNRRGRK